MLAIQPDDTELAGCGDGPDILKGQWDALVHHFKRGVLGFASWLFESDAATRDEATALFCEPKQLESGMVVDFHSQVDVLVNGFWR